MNNIIDMSKVINRSKNIVETTLVSTKKSRQATVKREEILMKSLVEFYSFSANLEQLLPVLLKKSNISLRILDWFVTNYSKEYQVCYQIIHLGRSKRFSVYDSYKAQLKAFHKKLFDPFCRRRRIYFEYCKDCEIETTVGQLNFFKWAIQNKILDYVEDKLERIVQHMALKNKEKQSEGTNSENNSMECTNDDDNTDANSNDESLDQEKIDIKSTIEINGEIMQEEDKTIVAKIGFK
jgi:hypothetical protein